MTNQNLSHTNISACFFFAIFINGTEKLHNFFAIGLRTHIDIIDFGINHSIHKQRSNRERERKGRTRIQKSVNNIGCDEYDLRSSLWHSYNYKMIIKDELSGESRCKSIFPMKNIHQNHRTQ